MDKETREYVRVEAIKATAAEFSQKRKAMDEVIAYINKLAEIREHEYAACDADREKFNAERQDAVASIKAHWVLSWSPGVRGRLGKRLDAAIEATLNDEGLHE